ncbi:MAG: UDP-N-acetyl glucosamine 2-epimerase [Gemmatimonadales bacterium]
MIALCYGTRPQVIKASVLRRALAAIGPVHAIDTGQHYDYALNALLYEQLGVAPPDRFLDAGSASHAEQTATILTRAADALTQLQPRAVVVIGDTNSTLGVALAATKLRLPVVHVEAGLRSVDRLMAEEINRRAVDAIATLLCTPCEAATRRMRAEHPDATVVESGDVARDVLESVQARLPAPGSIVAGCESPYLFATLHRAELTDVPARLGSVVRALASLGMRALLAVHPRTRAALASLGLDAVEQGALRLMPAVGYLESLALARGAAAVVTDSGGLQREAYWLGTPCITVRGETEWEETVALGANLLVPPEAAEAGLADAVRDQVARWQGRPRWNASVYGEGHAAEKVASAIATMPPCRTA